MRSPSAGPWREDGRWTDVFFQWIAWQCIRFLKKVLRTRFLLSGFVKMKGWVASFHPIRSGIHLG